MRILILNLLLIFLFNNLSYSQETFEINADKIFYKKNNELIIAKGNAVANDKFSRVIKANEINYNKNKNIIETFGSSKFESPKIKLNADILKYDLNTKTIFAEKNVEIIDKDKNKFLMDKLFFNEIEQSGEAYNIKAEFNDGSRSEHYCPEGWPQ